MDTVFSFSAMTLRTIGNAIALYFQPLLQLRSMKRRPRSSLASKWRKTQLDALIARGMLFEGDITCKEMGIRVDGHLIGNVACDDGMVVISRSAVIEGELRTAYAVINGTIKGNVIASKAVDIQAEARIEGDVYAPEVEIQPGALVRGQIETSETMGSVSLFVQHHQNNKR